MEKKFVLKELSRYSTGIYADILYRNALLYADELAIKCGEESVTFTATDQSITEPRIKIEKNERP